MRLSNDLKLNLSQKLILTPELRQAIEILQFNALELNEFIKNEMLSNPLLETTTNDRMSDISNNILKYNKNLMPLSNVYEEQDEIDPINSIANDYSIREHLLFQLQFAVLDNEEKKIARYIIETVDDNGYTSFDEDYISKTYNVNKPTIENIVLTLQTFDPYGVCSRNVKECLLNQLRFMGYENDLSYNIVHDYLDDLANNRLSLISKVLKADIFEVQKAVDIIRKLEPKPGRMYSSSSDLKFIRPDVFLKKDGVDYEITINEFSAPTLSISKYYQDMLSDKDLSEHVREYIHSNLNNSLRLIKSIEQRRNTIFRVVNEIVKYQKDFFEKGKFYLKKMNLKDISTILDIHESTVSRAINGKYLQTENGVYELKYFFSSGVESYDGEGISSVTIKETIKDLIANEDPRSPISDQDISNELNVIGIKISRRTIAKYRDELNIPGSSKRRRF
jgi:RNA polymerase sigma-54 factor